jgi:hypothetical protein
MDTRLFDDLTRELTTGSTRRRIVKRMLGFGAGFAVAAGLGRTKVAAAAPCTYGANTCASGYVWREAFAGDLACVDPSQRDQAAYDNASQYYRTDPNGIYGSVSCLSGYVWRDAYDGDGVCVEPWVRDQVHYDNSQAPYRIEAGCAYETTT